MTGHPPFFTSKLSSLLRKTLQASLAGKRQSAACIARGRQSGRSARSAAYYHRQLHGQVHTGAGCPSCSWLEICMLKHTGCSKPGRCQLKQQVLVQSGKLPGRQRVFGGFVLKWKAAVAQVESSSSPLTSGHWNCTSSLLSLNLWGGRIQLISVCTHQ